MAHLEWLAATLSSSDVAPHPNFFTTEQITEVSIFALVCAVRWGDVDRARDAAPNLDLTVAYAARDALTSGRAHIGADRLSEIVHTWSKESDPARFTALTLVASASYCDLDQYNNAFELLRFTAERLEEVGSADGHLLLAAVYQQLALRQYDYGDSISYIESAERAGSYIANLDRAALSDFPLSRGVNWSSSATLNDICEAINRASQSLLLLSESPFSDGWKELVRTRPGYLDLKALRSTADALTKFLDELFDTSMQSGARPSGRIDAEGSLFSALLSSEFSGDPSVRSSRSDLGKMRFLEGVERGEEWLFAESINLLRQGHDSRRLRNVVDHILNAGPLNALASCVSQIINNRDPASFSLGELIALRAGADQLPPDTATSYLPQITEMFSHPETFTLQQLAFKEEMFVTAAEFANVADSPTGFAGSLFELFQHLHGQELYQNAIVRALYVYDISKASEDEKDLWRAWLSGLDAHEMPAAASMISLIFNSDEIPRPHYGNVETLQTIASYADRWLHHGRQIPDHVIDQAVPLLIGSLRSIQEGAHEGRFSVSTVNSAAAAVVFAQYSGRQELWAELASFLSDPSIQRLDTRIAFDLIARKPFSAPDFLRDKLRVKMAAILYSAPEMFSSQKISPYPAALSYYISTRTIDLAATIVEISSLAGSDMEAARAAACTALSAYAAQIDAENTWVAVLSIQLSRDKSAVVRARAGRTLAVLLGRQSDLYSLILSRVNELLSEDGVAVPLNLVQELSGSQQPLDPQLTVRIQQLSTGSVSARVRKSALKLLRESEA